MVGEKRKTKSKIQREGRYGRFKARTRKIVYVRIPGGKTIIRYKGEKAGKAKCASCGAVLSGIPHKNVAELKKLPKTARRPERPYGGVLCSKCTRAKIIEKARSL